MLNAIGQGDPHAADELLSLVYEELRRLAAAKMACENPGQTLQPTALVHEAWLRLAGNDNRKWNDRSHFFAAAAEAMRRILVDNARRKRAQRHGGGLVRVEMPEISAPSGPNDDQLLAVNDALDKFAAQNKQKAELVKLRYFGANRESLLDLRSSLARGRNPRPATTVRSTNSTTSREGPGGFA
jgi:RNA polymerase sigma factor (TIGR02999 family)